MHTFLKKFGLDILVLAFITSWLPFLFYQAEFNTPYRIALEFGFVPLLCLSYLVWFKIGFSICCINNFIIKSFLPMGFAIFLSMCLAGYLIGINALIGKQTELQVSGRILDIQINGGRQMSAIAVISALPHGTQMKVPLTPEEFDVYRIGTQYKKVWTQGSLGLLYCRKMPALVGVDSRDRNLADPFN